MNENRISISKDTLAVLGNGKVGYIRKMTSDEVTERFPDAPEIQPGIDLWALFGADGTPILLSDDRSTAYDKAAEDELAAVSVH